MRTITTLLLIISLNSYSQSKKFTISGKLEGLEDTKILLANKPKNGHGAAFKVIHHDSCISRDGHFSFTGNIDEPTFYSIEVPAKGRRWLSFIVEGGNILITGSIDSMAYARITGSFQEDLYVKYINEVKRPLYKKQGRAKEMIDSLQKAGIITDIKKCVTIPPLIITGRSKADYSVLSWNTLTASEQCLN